MVLVLHKCSLGGGGQLPPAVLFFKTGTLPQMEALAAVGSCLRRFYFFSKQGLAAAGQMGRRASKEGRQGRLGVSAGGLWWLVAG